MSHLCLCYFHNDGVNTRQAHAKYTRYSANIYDNLLSFRSCSNGLFFVHYRQEFIVILKMNFNNSAKIKPDIQMNTKIVIYR